MKDILIKNNEQYKVMYNPIELYVYLVIEYNTDTSAQHLSSEEYGEEIV